ncbi:uracil phosphoribosyltransferase [Artemisia annua]|uniref:Uracil phosphoribosyltransferase n=1 Tax=Artemisia annua TaxID=35608 RepID=A0A2U1LD39_ARTAN|nr:uracil phosphoribosyltransferase [Artemisia annua]
MEKPDIFLTHVQINQDQPELARSNLSIIRKEAQSILDMMGYSSVEVSEENRDAMVHHLYTELSITCVLGSLLMTILNSGRLKSAEKIYGSASVRRTSILFVLVFNIGGKTNLEDRYIIEILLALGLLLGCFEFHSSGHPINPYSWNRARALKIEAFHVFENKPADIVNILIANRSKLLRLFADFKPDKGQKRQIAFNYNPNVVTGKKCIDIYGCDVALQRTNSLRLTKFRVYDSVGGFNWSAEIQDFDSAITEDGVVVSYSNMMPYCSLDKQEKKTGKKNFFNVRSKVATSRMSPSVGLNGIGAIGHLKASLYEHQAVHMIAKARTPPVISLLNNHQLIKISSIDHIQMMKKIKTGKLRTTLPDKFSEGTRVYIVYPMLATVAAIDLVKERGVDNQHIKVVSAMARPPALQKLSEKYPGVHVYDGFIDPTLTDKGIAVYGCSP